MLLICTMKRRVAILAQLIHCSVPFVCTCPLLPRTMKRLDPFQDIGNRVTRCRHSLPQLADIGNTHTSKAPTAMGPTVAMGLNEALVVPMFSDVFKVADDFAVTGAFAGAASSFETSGALAIEAGVSSEDPMMPRLPRGRVGVEPEFGWDECKYCDVCGMWLNGQEHYDEHLGTNRHRRLVEKAKTYARETCEQCPFPMSL
jgi:hypothetical protein